MSAKPEQQRSGKHRPQRPRPFVRPGDTIVGPPGRFKVIACRGSRMLVADEDGARWILGTRRLSGDRWKVKHAGRRR